MSTIRLPPTAKARKDAYLRAADGQPLAEWVYAVCDRAAGYAPCDRCDGNGVKDNGELCECNKPLME